MTDPSELQPGRMCSRCKRAWPREAFAGDRSTPDGLRAHRRGCSAVYYRPGRPINGLAGRLRATAPAGRKRCAQCVRISMHKYRARNHARNRPPSDRWAGCCRECRRSGIGALASTAGTVRPTRSRRMPMRGRGWCSICPSAESEHVDHGHRTGAVRAVLCFNCNSALGKLRDRPDTVRRAVRYVEGIVWKPTIVAPGVYRLPS